MKFWKLHEVNNANEIDVRTILDLIWYYFSDAAAAKSRRQIEQKTVCILNEIVPTDFSLNSIQKRASRNA